MNLLYHHRTQGKGVEAVHITSIVKELRKFGHDVEIMSPPGVNIEGNNHVDNLKNRSSVWKILSKRCPEVIFEIIEIAYNIYAYRMIKHKIQKSSIDGIYERYFLFSLSSYILSQKFGTKIIYEVNDSAFLCRVRPLFFKFIAKAIEKKVLSRAAHIVVVSKVFKRRLIDNGILANKITVLHNGFDPDLFSPKQTSLPEDICDKLSGKFIIGFTGLFVPWHGLDMLLKVFHGIVGKYNNAHLLLVGDGPVRPDLEKMIKVLNLKENVTITGTVLHEEVPAYLSSMDIGTMPNSNNYGSPMKIFEYMAVGLPVVSANYAPIAEIIEDGVNGLLFQPGDSKKMSDLIINLFDDNQLRKRIGENARRYVFNNHTWGNNASIIEKCFLQEDHNVLNQKSEYK